MIFENKEVGNKEKINGEDVNFEHDSSKEAWEHYRIIYFNNDGSCRINNEYQLTDLSQLVLRNYKNRKYYNEQTEKQPYINRYFLLSNDSKIYKIGDEYPGENANLSGDCDFNFNNRKYPIFEKMIREEYKNYPRGEKCALKLLTKCKKNHHRLVNFSLMQTKGNMQSFKGAKLKNGEQPSLDRADTLISYLASYYKLNREQRKQSCILANASNNKDTLEDYLNSFEDIYDYCEKIYLMDDRNFIDRMIEEGKRPITTGHDVIRYMLLALEFWDRKEKKIKKIYENYSSIEAANLCDDCLDEECELEDKLLKEGPEEV